MDARVTQRSRGDSTHVSLTQLERVFERISERSSFPLLVTFLVNTEKISDGDLVSVFHYQ